VSGHDTDLLILLKLIPGVPEKIVVLIGITIKIKCIKIKKHIEPNSGCYGRIRKIQVAVVHFFFTFEKWWLSLFSTSHIRHFCRQTFFKGKFHLKCLIISDIFVVRHFIKLISREKCLISDIFIVRHFNKVNFT
jgi:hypothetical protein